VPLLPCPGITVDCPERIGPPVPATDLADQRVDDTVRGLRALGIGIHTKLFVYLGLDRRHGRHLLDVVATRRRHGHIIDRDDAQPWVEGLALAQGIPTTVDRLLALDRDRPPKLLTLDAAAARIPSVDAHGNRRRPAAEGISPASIEYLIRHGGLYAVYGPDINQTRRFFLAQVDALAAARHALAAGREARDHPTPARLARAETARTRAEAAATRWATIENELPPAVGLTDVKVSPAYGPPVPRQTAALRLEALGIGNREGWFDLLWPVKDGGYLVQVALTEGEPIRRVVPESRVLPWVEGFGCWHRKESLVTFR
jgi:hypothetical protein